MTAQTITEATAHQLIDSIQKLEVVLAVTTEKLQNQAKWNDEQEKINLLVAEKLSDIEKKNITIDKRVEYIEDWKRFVNDVFKALLIFVLLAVAGAVLYLTYGGQHP